MGRKSRQRKSKWVKNGTYIPKGIRKKLIKRENAKLFLLEVLDKAGMSFKYMDRRNDD